MLYNKSMQSGLKRSLDLVGFTFDWVHHSVESEL